MTRTLWVAVMALALCVPLAQVDAATINGKVVDAAGKAMEGVTVSAFDEERQLSVSVFSQADGSFRIDGLRDVTHKLRARLMGQLDVWQEDVDAGAAGLSFNMKPATGEDLEDQRTADSGFSMLKWDSMKDKENYKMMCTYCHQTGSRGWRSPEEPVDWETMIKRMDGFGGLYKHTQETLVKRIVETYNEDAVAEWPAFVPPPAPTGLATKAKITEWDMGEQFKVMIHDLELGNDGIVYAVDMAKNACVSLDTKTGERNIYPFPGKYRGPHSIEADNDGNMWFTLCISGEMAKFDVKTKEFTICSSVPVHHHGWRPS